MADLADRISRGAVAALDLAPFDDRFSSLQRQVLAGGASRFARVVADDQPVHLVVPVAVAGEQVEYGALVVQTKRAGLVWRDPSGLDRWRTVDLGVGTTTTYRPVGLGGERWTRFDVSGTMSELSFLAPPTSGPQLVSTLVQVFGATPRPGGGSMAGVADVPASAVRLPGPGVVVPPVPPVPPVPAAAAPVAGARTPTEPDRDAAAAPKGTSASDDDAPTLEQPAVEAEILGHETIPAGGAEPGRPHEAAPTAEHDTAEAWTPEADETQQLGRDAEATRAWTPENGATKTWTLDQDAREAWTPEDDGAAGEPAARPAPGEGREDHARAEESAALFRSEPRATDRTAVLPQPSAGAWQAQPEATPHPTSGSGQPVTASASGVPATAAPGTSATVRGFLLGFVGVVLTGALVIILTLLSR